MNIYIYPPAHLPDNARSLLYTVEVNGDEAKVKVDPDGTWTLLAATGRADTITDWSFLAHISVD